MDSFETQLENGHTKSADIYERYEVMQKCPKHRYSGLEKIHVFSILSFALEKISSA